jgi:hypothetical protein
MRHWQKLNKLPIAPPSSTTSQFFPPTLILSLPPTSSALHRLDSASSRDKIALGSFDSRSVYHATKRGKRGRSIVNAIESADVTNDGSERTQQVEDEGNEDDFDHISSCLASDRCHCISFYLGVKTRVKDGECL